MRGENAKCKLCDSNSSDCYQKETDLSICFLQPSWSSIFSSHTHNVSQTCPIIEKAVVIQLQIMRIYLHDQIVSNSVDTSIDSRSVTRFTTFIISARQCDPSSRPFRLLFSCVVATIKIVPLIVVFHNYILFAWPFEGRMSPISLMPKMVARLSPLLTAAPFMGSILPLKPPYPPS